METSHLFIFLKFIFWIKVYLFEVTVKFAFTKKFYLYWNYNLKKFSIEHVESNQVYPIFTASSWNTYETNSYYPEEETEE